MTMQKVKGKTADGTEVEIEVDLEAISAGQQANDGNQQTNKVDWESVKAKLSEEELAAYEAEVAGLKSALNKERAEAKAARKAAADAAAAKAQEEDEKLPELERATKAREQAERRAAELEAKILKDSAETALRLAAVQLGMSDPEDAVTMIAQSGLERDDSGKPTNAEALVKELLTKKPYLKKSVEAPGGAPARGTGRKPGSGQKAPAPNVTL